MCNTWQTIYVPRIAHVSVIDFTEIYFGRWSLANVSLAGKTAAFNIQVP